MEILQSIRPLSAYEIDQVEGGAAFVYLGPSVNINVQNNVATIVIAGTIINRSLNIIGIRIRR